MNNQINLTDWRNMILSGDLRIEYNHNIYSDFKTTYDYIKNGSDIVCPVVQLLPDFVINVLRLGKVSKACDIISQGTVIIEKHLDGQDWITIATDYVAKGLAGIAFVASLRKYATPVTAFGISLELFSVIQEENQ